MLVRTERVAEPAADVAEQYNTLFEKWMQTRSVLAQIPVGF
jgi:hypothetical protein